MGLDQFMYSAAKAGTKYDDSGRISLGTRRKHPNLQGWMERLWWSKIDVPVSEGDQFEQDKYPPGNFNGIELELTWQDLDQLEKDIINERVSKLDTKGFFFGNPSDSHYREYDLQFIKDAKAQLFLGLKVFYNSSW